jgi:hypothetical protein
VASNSERSDSAGGELERSVLPLVPFENVGQWLETLARLRRAVARFEPQPSAQSTEDCGTGFLVAPDLLMTNRGGIPDRREDGSAEGGWRAGAPDQPVVHHAPAVILPARPGPEAATCVTAPVLFLPFPGNRAIVE